MGAEISQPEPFPSHIPPSRLPSRTLPGIASYLLANPTLKIAFMVGAGISTAAGIPDFRSPNSGLYSRLSRNSDLNHPEDVFDIRFFRDHPEPFYQLAAELWPGKYRPTYTHCFMAVACAKGRVKRIWTQNIDTLELEAGIDDELCVFAHGCFAGQSCIDCKEAYADRAKFEKRIRVAQIVRCKQPDCHGLVKPNIVFFGESLPRRYHESLPLLKDPDVGLAMVMGSSLSVYPFAALPLQIGEDVPRLLVNNEKVGDIGSRRDDVLHLEDCDSACLTLAKELGWESDVTALWNRCHRKALKEKSRVNALSPDDRAAYEARKIAAEVDDVLKGGREHQESVRKMLEKVPATSGSADDNGPRGLMRDRKSEKKRSKEEGDGQRDLNHIFPHLSLADDEGGEMK